MDKVGVESPERGGFEGKDMDGKGKHPMASLLGATKKTSVPREESLSTEVWGGSLFGVQSKAHQEAAIQIGNLILVQICQQGIVGCSGLNDHTLKWFLAFL